MYLYKDMCVRRPFCHYVEKDGLRKLAIPTVKLQSDANHCMQYTNHCIQVGAKTNQKSIVAVPSVNGSRQVRSAEQITKTKKVPKLLCGPPNT